jgi:hypothetical protein
MDQKKLVTFNSYGKEVKRITKLVSDTNIQIPYKTDSKVKVSRGRTKGAQGVPGRLRPQIFLTFRHYKGGRSSAKSTGRLYPRRNP